MPDTNTLPETRQPILMVMVGRQRVGKTTIINTIIQKTKEGGGQLGIWDADVNNTSYNLGMFHDDVLVPASSASGDVGIWLEQRLDDQILGRYDAVLDVGGGDTPFTRLIQELPLVEELEASGILVVAVHVIGPEQADVDYLQAFALSGVLQSRATLIVLNSGLVTGNRQIGPAFGNVTAHPSVQAAIGRGARLVFFPSLSCLSEVTDRKLTFRECATHVSKPGMSPMMRFDRTRTRLWFDKAVPEALAEIPPLWLPEAIQSAVSIKPVDPEADFFGSWPR